MTVTTIDEGTIPEPASAPDRADGPPEASRPVLVAEELLVEDVSIDGMCGVY